jgi:hypothetical protein
MQSGLTAAVLNGANAPKTSVQKRGMEPSPAPAFRHPEDGAPAFEVYDQADQGNREVTRDAAAIEKITRSRDPRHQPKVTQRTS